jgi:hypothetical protein
VGEGVGEGEGEGVGDSVGESVGDGVGEGVGEGVGDSVGDDVGEGVGESVGGAGVGEGVGVTAKATKLTVGVGVASLVIQPVQFTAVRRVHLSAAVMDPAVGYASYIWAASPATCGQAMDVPVLEYVWVLLNGPSETTFVPGA